MNKSTIFITLAIFSLVLLTSCQKDQLEIGDQISQIDVAKKGVTDPSIFDPGDVSIFNAKKGKGKMKSTFDVSVSGDLWSNLTYAASGSWNLQTDYGIYIDLHLEGLDLTPNCFDGHPPELLTVLTVKEERDGTAFSGYWFRGKGTDGVTVLDYHIWMYGHFDNNNWPPAIGQTVDVVFTSWELDTKSKKNRNLACRGSGDFAVTITVTRTS